MGTKFTVDESARTRLRDAQKAEATALKAVEAAELVRGRAQRSLDSTASAVATAYVALVRVSGVDRAALLLDLPAKELRRVLRDCEADTSSSLANDPSAADDAPCAPLPMES